MSDFVSETIVVVGAGITGLSAALEAADFGYKIVLVEKKSYLGGRVAQLHEYFPKLCPPYCGLEINFKRIRSNPNIIVHTLAEVEKIEGQAGNFIITIKKLPRYVNDKCTACGKCAEAISATIKNPFDFELSEIKAAYLPHPLAQPPFFIIDPSVAEGPEGQKAFEACPYDAVDLGDLGSEEVVHASAIIWATGWTPYDPTKIEYYNYNSSPDIITNVIFERLAAANGPTGGKIQRPSNGSSPKSVAFVQCVGSRAEDDLPFCSSVCCMATLKQTTYLMEKLPEAEATIYFIDIRAMDRNEDFYNKVKENPRVKFIKSKIAMITPDKDGNLLLEGENTINGERFKVKHDLVVLATGMQPNTALQAKIPFDVIYDSYGFAMQGTPGIIPAGAVCRPADVMSCVQDGTSAVIKAIQAGRR